MLQNTSVGDTYRATAWTANGQHCLVEQSNSRIFIETFIETFTETFIETFIET